VAAGAAAVVVLRLVQDAELEILITLVLAYGSYLAADVIHASGRRLAASTSWERWNS